MDDRERCEGVKNKHTSNCRHNTTRKPSSRVSYLSDEVTVITRSWQPGSGSSTLILAPVSSRMLLMTSPPYTGELRYVTKETLNLQVLRSSRQKLAFPITGPDRSEGQTTLKIIGMPALCLLVGPSSSCSRKNTLSFYRVDKLKATHKKHRGPPRPVDALGWEGAFAGRANR